MSAQRLRSLAQHALNTHKYDEALNLYAKAIAIEPQNVENYYARALTYLRKRKYPSVLRDLRLALEVDPQYLKAYLLQGRMNTLRGNCADAVVSYEHVLRLKPGHTGALQNLPKVKECATETINAEKAMERRDFQKAYEHLTAAVSVATESPTLYLMRAKAQAELNRPDGVLDDTRVVLQANENNMEALLLRGTYYYQKGDLAMLELALTHFRRGLKLDPEHKAMKRVYKLARKIQRFLKNAKESENEPQDAKDFYENALKIDPTNTAMTLYIKTELCRLYVNMQDGYLSTEACGELVKAHPNDPDLLKLLGNANILAEKFDEAIRNFEAVLRINEGDKEAREGVNRAKLEQKKAGRKNYYKILGVPKNANGAQIKKAYRKKALEFHPDKHPEDKKAAMEKIFIDVGEAYEILSDEEKRGRYDSGEDVEIKQNPHQHFHQHFRHGGGQTFTFRFG